MPNSDYTKLNAQVSQIGDTLLMSQLETNLKTYLDWGLIGIGSFSNVSIPTSGAYGGTYDRLRLVNDPSYTLGQVWETPRKDWVWETGTEYTTQPTDVSGVYINGSLYTTGHADYGHHYNYPLGRVIFDSAINTSSRVQVNYAYRNVQTYVADQAPWWQEIQYNSYRVENFIGSGEDRILANHRVQLPAVVIEAVPQRTFRPYELGTLGQLVYQDVNFHIIAESRWWRNQLLDIISFEKDKVIWLYDNNKIADVTGYPLDFRGMTVRNPIMYSTLVGDKSNFRFKRAKYHNMVVTDMTAPTSRLYQGIARATFEVIMA
tara:strand:+ start:775 stop:1728 length:954 start_codon:yes stop_codon:yes gene_type:complete